jgi:acetyl/propionyl-CoA carboxylase alpha subunit
VHLGERECSVQRRHQKLIEESPSTAVDPDLRERMGSAALRLARAAGYSNAGTVEFLLLPEGEFAFLEVNARLQVEHPVTELVTGLVLVELQLRVAAGEPLGFAQSDVQLHGHAIEVRVVAEDPLADWLPSSGRIDDCVLPTSVRVDTWVAEGTTVSSYYDSLLAKLIAHGATRDAALANLKDALRRTWIDGVATNLDVLLGTLEEPAFGQGSLHTGFLEEHAIVEGTAEVPEGALAAATAAERFDDPWRARTGWRMGGIDYLLEWVRAGRLHRARLDRDQLRTLGEVLALGQRRVVSLEGRSYRLEPPKGPPLERAARATGGGGLSAPMPARVAKIVVAPGEEVAQNQPLVVLEAMKMEHVVEAPHAGVVAQVCVAVGEQVSAGTELVVLE